MLLLGTLGASQMGVALVNLLMNRLVGPRLLPRLGFSTGIPAADRTMVVIPTLLTSPRAVNDLLEGLEIRYLGNRDPNLWFALLTDFRDAPELTQPDDEGLLRQVREGIQALNARYCPVGVAVFHLLHRPRVWNPHERLWMGSNANAASWSSSTRCCAAVRGRRSPRSSARWRCSPRFATS